MAKLDFKDETTVKYYYVTAASGEKFIKNYAQYALKSLIKTGIPLSRIHCVVNTKNDLKLLKSLIPEKIKTYVLNEDLSKIRWKSHNGKRKYSVFKAAVLHKIFGNKVDTYERLCYFDGDVLFFKDPAPFFDTRNDCTFFHHGKDLETVSVRKSRAGRLMKKHEVNINDIKSLSKWVSYPCAYSMIKRGAKKVPDTEAVAGFYLLHPRDHRALLKLTYKCCLDIVEGIKDHVDVGDQKPMNAALNILETNWKGGSRFKCPEHKKYFVHYFGVTEMKDDFHKKVKELGL